MRVVRSVYHSAYAQGFRQSDVLWMGPHCAAIVHREALRGGCLVVHDVVATAASADPYRDLGARIIRAAAPAAGPHTRPRGAEIVVLAVRDACAARGRLLRATIRRTRAGVGHPPGRFCSW